MDALPRQTARPGPRGLGGRARDRRLRDRAARLARARPALLAQVRRTLALGTGCRYCQAKAGPPDRSHADSRTAAAVELAEHFARDHRGIDEMVLARARDHFADAELCELIMFMGFMWAG